MTDTQDPTGDQIADTELEVEADAAPDVAGADAGGLVARRIRSVIEHGRDSGPGD